MTLSQHNCEVSAVPHEGLVVEFDPKVYRLSAVKKASYKFGDRFHILIGSSTNSIHVTLRAKDEIADPAQLVGEFCNEVLDQDLREQVAQETEAIRNLLMAQAFSATSLVDEAGDDGDFRDDPLGISQSHGTS
jgi:His-Xaa-Ser system protein HxsD